MLGLLAIQKSAWQKIGSELYDIFAFGVNLAKLILTKMNARRSPPLASIYISCLSSVSGANSGSWWKRRVDTAPGAFDDLGFAAALGLDLQLKQIPSKPPQRTQEIPVSSRDLKQFSRSTIQHIALRPLEGLDPIAAWAGILDSANNDFLNRMRASRADQDYFNAVRSALFSSESRFACQVRYGETATRAAEILQGRSGHFPPAPPFPIKATHLLKHGLTEGPELGQALTKAREQWIASKGQLSRRALLDDLIKSKT